MKHYTIYQVTNTINGKIYIGQHITSNPNDSYFGSGLGIKRAIAKYGKDNFVKVVLFDFDNREDMIAKEIELVDEIFVKCSDTYNDTIGGKGGFYYIQKHRLNHGVKNVMKRPEVAEKQQKARMITRNKNKQYYDTVAINNLAKTYEIHRTRDRTKQTQEQLKRSTFFAKNRTPEEHETWRLTIASTFEVTDPTGVVYNTNELEKFCKEHNLGYGALWNSSRTNKAVTKGKSQGWICKKI